MAVNSNTGNTAGVNRGGAITEQCVVVEAVLASAKVASGGQRSSLCVEVAPHNNCKM